MVAIHHIIDRVVFYGLLVTIAVTAIPYGAVQTWWVALFECLVFILAIVAIIDLLITKDGLPPGASTALPLVILCMFLLFQSLPLFAANNPVISDLRLSISADPFTTQLLSIKLFAFILAGVMLLRYTNSKRRLRILVYVLIGISVASALLGLVRQSTGGPAWFFPLPRLDRGFAQFVNRNHFGFLIEITFGLAIGFALRGARGFQRWLLVSLAAFLWITLIVVNSRGAILASLCQLLLLAILFNPFRLRVREDSASRATGFIKGFAVQAVLMILLISAFAFGVRWVGGEQVASNLELTTSGFSEQGGHEHRENVSRRDIWRATWNLIKSHPIIGSGFGAYWIAITKYHDASGRFTPQEAHNDYLELLAGGGLIGMGLVGWFVFRFLKATRKVFQDRPSSVSGIAIGAFVGIFGVAVHSVVEFGIHITINGLLLTTAIAIPLVAVQLGSKNTLAPALLEE